MTGPEFVAPRFRLDGRHATVTGAGRGLGRACALSLANAGAIVTLVSRTRAELDTVVGEIEALGGRAWAIIADVTDVDQVEEAVAAAAVNGPLSICVNNAGINRPGPTVKLSVDDWDAVISANLRSTFLVSRAVARGLLAEGRGGRIINISSQMGSVGYPGRAAYCAAKHGVNGLTKALAVEWAPHAITVNAVAPTFLYTPLTSAMFEDEVFHGDVLRRIPMGRIGEVNEVTGAVVFLASDAGSLVTGHVLAVDGGWTAW